MNNPVLPYKKSSTDGVWQRPEIEAFAYSDGDEVENRIAAILTSVEDLSVLSGELRTHITDWPTDYHLSSQRANLLRPISQHLTGSILEIGSGCGAITRYLGETATSVLALEGSRRRAHISRTRTRDLHNVEVFCDEFSAFKTPNQFDAVTLIGVLEYAHMFIADEQAALRMLEKTTALLNESGCLIIAIENQLGLKYFAGAPEDHLGIPVLGIEDQYIAKGVRTYGKQALTQMLQQAGYQSIEFLHPFPDYKMPSCVLGESAFSNPRFNARPFLLATAGKDPQLPLEPSFSLERAWPVIESNGLASDLSNSFLIVAKKQPDNSTKSTEFAWHFSTQRRPEFCKETIFSVIPDTGHIKINRNLLGLPGNAKVQSGNFTHKHVDTTPYSTNELLSNQLVQAITRSKWTYGDIAGIILNYAKYLAQISNTAFVINEKINWEKNIPGEFFDCIPQNISISLDGTPTTFDLEWHSVKPLNFKHLAFRSLWTTVGEISLIGKNLDGQQISLFELACETFKPLGCSLSEEDAFGIVQQELEFQSQVSGKTINPKTVWDWIFKGTLRDKNSHESLERHKRDCATLIAHIRHTEATHKIQLDGEIATKEQALATVQRTQSAISQIQQEANEGYKAIRRLTQASYKQFIERKSPKNFVKQWREYRQVMGRSAATSPLPSLSISPLSACKSYFGAQKTVQAFSRVATVDHAHALLKRSTHWAIPFQWTFACEEKELPQSVAPLAQELGIEVTFEIGPKETTSIVGIDSTALQSNSLSLFLKSVSAHPEKRAFEGPLPDAESIRLAYMAMATDSKISLIYIGTPDLPRAVDTTHTARNYFCLIRQSTLKDLSNTTSLIKQHVDFSELKIELSLVEKHARDSGQSVLTI